MALITLTTDFGTGDYYVGAVKGVILGLAPQARLVDLTHEVPPQDVLAGAFVLHHAAREFPPGTVHLAVVDPGVGTARRPLVTAGHGHLWVGPDNGLLSYALADPGSQARQIAHPQLGRPRSSATFQARDLFAPAAAHLALGFPFAQVGPAVSDPMRLAAARPRPEGGRLAGQVVHVDRFGNLVTNLSEEDLAPWRASLRLILGRERTLTRLSRTYADEAPGALLALIGSAGLLEISVNGGHAARALGLRRGDPVVLERA